MTRRNLDLLVYPLVMSALACGGPAPYAPPTPEPAASAESPAASAAPSASASSAAPADTSSAAAASSSADATPPPPPEDDLRLHLVDAGHQPRKALRYRFKVGAIEQMQLDMRMAMAVGPADSEPREIQLPTVRTMMRTEPQSVTPDGCGRDPAQDCELKYGFTIVSMNLLPDATVPPAIQSKLEAELGKSAGLSGWAVVTSRGLTKQAEFDAPPGASNEVRQMLQSLQQGVRQLATPLPQEPVGVGASWETVSSMMTDNVRLTQTTTYKLTSLTGDKGGIDLTMTQTAPAQPMRPAGVPPEVKVMLESLGSTGSGTMKFDLAHLVPTSDAGLETKLVAHVSAPGQDQRMGTRIRMKIAVRPAPSK
jgi:hypothetical protein